MLMEGIFKMPYVQNVLIRIRLGCMTRLQITHEIYTVQSSDYYLLRSG